MGETNDLLIIFREIYDFYTVSILPEIGSDGDTFTAVVSGSRWSNVIYDTEVINTSNSYDYVITPEFSLTTYQSSNNLTIAWPPVASNLQVSLQHTLSLTNWTEVVEDVEQTTHFTRHTVSSTNLNQTGFYKVIIEE